MVTSPEEAQLLLNKWMIESARLVAFAASIEPPANFVVRLIGSVSRIEEETGTVLFESESDFIVFRLADVIEYKESVEISADIQQLLSQNRETWNAALCLTYPHSHLLFCANV